MMTGGPIVEYFKNWAPEPNNTLCFVGYQADGTLGRRLQKDLLKFPSMTVDKHTWSVLAVMSLPSMVSVATVIDAN